MKYDLKNQLVLITGASSGIGREIAIAFSQHNARLILIARNESKLSETQSFCLKNTPDCHIFIGDIGNWDTVKKLGNAIKDTIGIPDIIVNNAGEGCFLAIDECVENDVEHALKSPFLSSFYWVQFFIKDFMSRNSGIILNVNTPAAYFPFPKTIAYSCTRAAVRCFSRCLRLDLKGYRIKIQDLVPGLTKSNYFENNNMDWNKRIPFINRLFFKPLTPQEVAKAALKGLFRKQKLICPQPLMTFFIVCAQYFPNTFDFLVSLKSK